MKTPRKPLRALLASLLFIGNSGPQLAQATDYYVDQVNGSDANTCLAAGAAAACQTITYALSLANAAASPPHSVYVAPGFYDDVGNGETFPLEPGDSVSLIGAGAGDWSTPLTWVEQDNAVIPTFRYAANLVNPSSTILAGFYISNGGGGDGILIAPQNPADNISPVIINNIITAMSNAAIHVAGVAAGAVAAPLIRNNGIAGSAYGILANGNGKFLSLIDSNTIAGNGTDAINLSPGGASDVFSPMIFNNNLSGEGSTFVGIHLLPNGNTTSPRISSNVITGTRAQAIFVEASGVSTASPFISNNTISNPVTGGGIYIQAFGQVFSSATISSNSISGFSGTAISIAVAGGAGSTLSMDISSNTLTGNTGSGITINGIAGDVFSFSISTNTIVGGQTAIIIGGSPTSFAGVIDRNSIQTPSSFGIEIIPASPGNDFSPRITSNTITNAGSSGIFFYPGNNNTTSPLISRNTITGSSFAGIYLYSNGTTPVSASPAITNNTISGGGKGIHFYSYGSLASSALISSNTIVSPGGEGIRVQAADASDQFSIEISSNLISGSGSVGLLLKDYGGGGVSPVIRNNTITGSVSNRGMYLYAYGTSALSFSSNTVSGNSNNGVNIYVGDTASPIVSRNTVTGNNFIGIGIYGNSATCSATVTANTMTGNKSSGLVFSGLFAASPPPVITNNWIAGNGLTSFLAEFQLGGPGAGGENSPVVSRNTVISSGGNKALVISGISNADLGGGALGSVGHNTFIGLGGNADLDATTAANPIVANYNWWSATPPTGANIIAGPGVTVSTPMAQTLSFSPSPASGPPAGGTTITISTSEAGTAFVDNVGSTATRIEVTINGVPVTNIVVSPDGYRLTGVAPAGTSGAKTLLVKNPSGHSGTSTYTYGSAPASAPTGLRGNALGVSSITWSWTAFAGATSYNFYPSTGGAPINVAGTSVTQTLLSTNTAYGGQVSGLNAVGEGSLSTAVSSFTLAAPPASFTVVSVSSYSASLTWDANTNPNGTSYVVSASTPDGILVSSVAVTAAAVTLTGLSAETTYTLTLSALNGDGRATASGVTLSTETTSTVSQSALPGGGGTVNLNPPTGPVVVDIPPGSLPSGVNVTVSVPASFPSAASSGDLDSTGVGIEINLDQNVQPASPVTLSVGFRDADVVGKSKDQLTLARYDAERQTWVQLISSVDKANNKVSAKTRHFSIFQIMVSAGANDMNSVRVIPNPFRPNQGHVAVGFFNLPAFARVRIYSFAGEVIRDLTANATGLAVWDGNNADGRAAASGVYVVYAQGAGGSKTFKVAVQR